MALETKLLQKLSQNLLMTPQLQQAIKLLQLGRQEFIQEIAKEVMENPVLEDVVKEEEGEEKNSLENHNNDLKENDRSASSDDDFENDEYLKAQLENLSDYRGVNPPKGMYDENNARSLEQIASKEQTLSEYLIEQLMLSDLNSRQRQIALAIICNLDNRGYLACQLNEVANIVNASIEEAEKVLLEVQKFDPVGVGSRDIKECLLLQLDSKGLSNSLPATIVKKHLKLIEGYKFDLIAKEEGISQEEVLNALKLLRSLEPNPGRQFIDEAVRYIEPDVYVYKVGNEYVVTLNEDGMPKLKVSSYYLNILKRNDENNEESKKYLTEKLKSASWLIKSIHQRQQTIFKVAESIVKFQQDFMENGIQSLKPLVLKQVADDVGVHESTVSRVTTNKYMHTPQGLYEFKFFFTTGLSSNDGAVSSSAIKDKIKLLIEQEDPKKPISDQKITNILKAEGIDIARRTVAKYRESLNIPPSSQRKRKFKLNS